LRGFGESQGVSGVKKREKLAGRECSLLFKTGQQQTEERAASRFTKSPENASNEVFDEPRMDLATLIYC
jgi:hypothetical protein